MANTVPNIDPKIVEILSAYDESADGGAGGNLWFVQGQAVILHKCVERIAARAKIVFEEPQIIRAEREEAVILVRARLGDRWDYDIGEALVNVNYRVSGRQAAYVFAMALKRGRSACLKARRTPGPALLRGGERRFRSARRGPLSRDRGSESHDA